MQTPAWQCPPTQNQLQSNFTAAELHLWLADLDAIAPEVTPYWQVLTAEEQARAQRFVQDQHRHRFVVGRGILRHLLGQYLDALPQTIPLSYGPKGKPQHPDVAFNLSHSQGLALFAFTALTDTACDDAYAVGVDLEALRLVPYLTQLSQRYFAAAELAFLAAADPEQQIQPFFRLWTCKEAYLKATGEGISQLQQIAVLPDAAGQLQLYPSRDPSPWHSSSWQLLEFCPAPGYQAALAYAGPIRQIRFWQFDQGGCL